MSWILRHATTAILLGLTIATSGKAVTITFDYSRDTSNFFGVGTDARASLEAAGQFFSDNLLDDLDEIQESGPNTWSANFTNPSTGAADSEAGLFVPADTLIIYVGARELGGTTLGQAGPGGFSAGGFSSWLTTVSTRGEGDTQTPGAVDFGPWGGALAIDNVGTNWNLDHTATPTGGQFDLYSVILHELGHVLGWGTADSYDELVNGSNQFTGSESVALFGGNIPLHADGAHWASGTTSTVFPGGASQTANLTPAIGPNTTRDFTDLDMAALNDIGWEVVPEPSTYVLAFVGILIFGAIVVRRRRLSHSRADIGQNL